MSKQRRRMLGLDLVAGSRGLGDFFLDDLPLGEPFGSASTEAVSAGRVGAAGAGTGVG